MHDVLDEVVGDARHHHAEHLEALTLPLGGRILLTHRPKVNALAKQVHLTQVLTPALIDDAQHHLTLNLTQHRLTELTLAGLIERQRFVVEHVVEFLRARGCLERSELDPGRPQGFGLSEQRLEIPLLGNVAHAIGGNRSTNGVVEVLERFVAQVGAVENLPATPVDHLALLVHHFVVLQDVLTGLGVAALDSVLGPFDRPGDHLRLERDIVG